VNLDSTYAIAFDDGDKKMIKKTNPILSRVLRTVYVALNEIF
jgi:hypothetical protein